MKIYLSLKQYGVDGDKINYRVLSANIFDKKNVSIDFREYSFPNDASHNRQSFGGPHNKVFVDPITEYVWTPQEKLSDNY